MGKKKHVKFFPGHKTAPVKLLAKVLPLASVCVVSTVAALNFSPTVADAFPSSVVSAASKCYTLQHKIGDDMYTRGMEDVYFLAHAFFALTFGRYAVGWFFLGPLAKLIGVKKEERGKFVENGWQVMYYTLAWTAGAHLMSSWDWDIPSFFAEHPAKGYSAFCEFGSPSHVAR